MANPQLEHGYTRIANEILEALAVTNLNGTQRRILDVIFRQTYGYQRKEHEISLNFLANATGIHKMQIQRELTALIDRKIITVASEASFNKSRVLAFNKNYKEWLNSEQLAKQLTGNENDNHTVSEIVNRTVSESANQKKKKENIKENRANFSSYNANTENTQKPDEKYEDLFETLWKLYPNKKGKSAVSEKSKKAIYEIGCDRIVKAIDNYKKDLVDNPWKQMLYGSTFFNGRYKDYLQVEANDTEVRPTGRMKVLTDEDIQKNV